MIADNQDWVVIGRFGRPHGLKGFVSVNSFTEPRENILNYQHWHMRAPENAKHLAQAVWKPAKIIAVEVNTKSILVQIDGFAEREKSAELTNFDIAVLRNQLPVLKPGEYYWHQLTGMKVVNSAGVVFGDVIELFATGSNDVLVVQGEKRHLIPFLMNDVVIEINELEKTMVVDWDVDFN